MALDWAARTRDAGHSDGLDVHRAAAVQQDAEEISMGNDPMGVDSDGRGSAEQRSMRSVRTTHSTGWISDANAPISWAMPLRCADKPSAGGAMDGTDWRGLGVAWICGASAQSCPAMRSTDIHGGAGGMTGSDAKSSGNAMIRSGQKRQSIDMVGGEGALSGYYIISMCSDPHITAAWRHSPDRDDADPHCRSKAKGRAAGAK